MAVRPTQTVDLTHSHWILYKDPSSIMDNDYLL
jgi:hypothetical protein